LIIMRNNFSINIVSVIVDSLISYYAVIEDSRLSRKLRIVRLLFDRKISGINIFIINTFNDVDLFNCGDGKRRICRMGDV
jgi:hypothetical protein